MRLWILAGLGVALLSAFVGQQWPVMGVSDWILQTARTLGVQGGVPTAKSSYSPASSHSSRPAPRLSLEVAEKLTVGRSRAEFENCTLQIVSPMQGARLGLSSPIQLRVSVANLVESPEMIVQEVKAVLKYGGGDHTVWEYEVPPLPSDNAEVVVLVKVEENSTSATFEAEVKSTKIKAGFVTISYIAVFANGFHLEQTTSNIIGDTEPNIDMERSRSLMLDKQSRVSADARMWKSARDAIAANYKPLHPEIRHFQEEYLSTDFWTQNITELEGMPGVYIVPQVFSSEFLRLLNEELTYAQTQSNNWTRPNTMNNFGFMLSELGFDSFLDDFVTRVLDNMRARFLPAWGKLDSHHAFTIGYGAEEDKSLDRHMDLSEVTLNVCMEKAEGYTGTRLFFDGIRDNERPRTFARHLKNSALFHPGQFWHGAASTEDSSSSTNRRNLIIWGRSSSYRSSPLEHFLQPGLTTPFQSRPATLTVP